MQTNDFKTIAEASVAWERAWMSTRHSLYTGLCERAKALAISKGIVFGIARGELQNAELERTALDHLAVAALERQTSTPLCGCDEGPAWSKDPERLLHHAEQMRVMASHVRTPRCRELLLGCSRDFEHIATAHASLGESIALLYPPAESENAEAPTAPWHPN